MKKIILSLLLMGIISTGMYAHTKDTDHQPPTPLNSMSSGCDTLLSGPNGIKDQMGELVEMKLYPNPATTNINVRLDLSKVFVSEPISIYILNMKGSVVMSLVDYAKAGTIYTNDFDIRVLPDDEYIFQLIKGDLRQMKKFQVYH